MQLVSLGAATADPLANATTEAGTGADTAAGLMNFDQVYDQARAEAGLAEDQQPAQDAAQAEPEAEADGIGVELPANADLPEQAGESFGTLRPVDSAPLAPIRNETPEGRGVAAEAAQPNLALRHSAPEPAPAAPTSVPVDIGQPGPVMPPVPDAMQPRDDAAARQDTLPVVPVAEAVRGRGAPVAAVVDREGGADLPSVASPVALARIEAKGPPVSETGRGTGGNRGGPLQVVVGPTASVPIAATGQHAAVVDTELSVSDAPAGDPPVKIHAPAGGGFAMSSRDTSGRPGPQPGPRTAGPLPDARAEMPANVALPSDAPDKALVRAPADRVPVDGPVADVAQGLRDRMELPHIPFTGARPADTRTARDAAGPPADDAGHTALPRPMRPAAPAVAVARAHWATQTAGETAPGQGRDMAMWPAAADAAPDDIRPVERQQGLSAAHPVAHGSGVLRADAARLPVAQVAEMLTRLPERPVQISLSPAELGRVRMSLSTHETAGSLTLIITAERPETLELMRRHIDGLAQEFRRIGYDDVGFQFREGPGGGMGDGGRRDRDTAAQSARAPDRTTDPAPVPPARLAARGGLDLRL